MTDTAARQIDRRATRAALDHLFGAQLLFGGAFWLVFALVMVTVPVLVSRSGGQMDTGVLHATGYAARWFAFALGTAGVAAVLTIHLAAGGTRRALHRAAVLSALLVVVLYGALFAVAQLGERALWGGLGWTWVRPGGIPGDGGTGIVLGAVGEGLACATYALVGSAVAVAYHRLRALRGTLALLPSLVVLALADMVTGTGTGGETLGNLVATGADTAPALVTGLAGGTAVAVLAAAWLHLFLRRAQLRPRT
ncbi:hypothetical protein DNL40_11810 [Xylanimonas oleitrophica]|uniref:Uncharacterized protein n=1 Tax=Xylanimonas oleitrophica TaxID=2607479 RepID=A0A2W5WVP7_9MICO|nr:hypothetical protein [Xylanimonas oleitrophica]PZR52356.1 hypothetical protein DNL40_11810 [Xylanimonas oleitrophica]